MIKAPHIKHLKTVGLLLLVVILFSLSLYIFFYGEITNATTLVDYLYFGMMTTTTLNASDMNPTTQRLRIYISLYIFTFLYVLIFSNVIVVDFTVFDFIAIYHFNFPFQ